MSLRFASENRSDSQRCIPYACTTRIPLTASCTISERSPAVDCACPVTRFSRLASRATGSSVSGTAPNATSDMRQSSTKQETSITMTREPVPQVARDRVRHGGLDGEHVGGEPLEDVAGVAACVEGGREPQQVIEQRAAHVGDHPLPDHAHEEELPEVRDSFTAATPMMIAAALRGRPSGRAARACRRGPMRRARIGRGSRGRVGPPEQELEGRPEQVHVRGGRQRQHRHAQDRAASVGLYGAAKRRSLRYERKARPSYARTAAGAGGRSLVS